MRRSARLAEKQEAKLGKETWSEPKAKKRRSDDRISNIATMDNGTMVESFKFLNYFQLAKNSLASKRFRDVIRMHRHRLALLYVESIEMKNSFLSDRAIRRICHFGEDLSSEEYNAWIVRNEYSKQIPLQCQIAEMESTEDEREFYDLTGCFKVNPKLDHETNLFYARAKLNHENWPLFEHFIRLLTDPFIYVQRMELSAQKEILHLLEKAMNPDHNLLQCYYLSVYLEGNAPKFISWIKDHVQCDQLNVYDSNELNYDRELLDFFMTGANCSFEVCVSWRLDSFPKIVDDFVQKFLDLKACDKYQIVETIEVNVRRSIDELKEKYTGFIVKEKFCEYDGTTKYTFEFVNDNIRKKLQLTNCMMEDPEDGYDLYCYVYNL